MFSFKSFILVTIVCYLLLTFKLLIDVIAINFSFIFVTAKYVHINNLSKNMCFVWISTYTMYFYVLCSFVLYILLLWNHWKCLYLFLFIRNTSIMFTTRLGVLQYKHNNCKCWILLSTLTICCVYIVKHRNLLHKIK